MEVAEQDTSAHRSVQEVSEEEVMALGVRGGAGSRLQGIWCLWAPPGDGDLLLIPGEGDIGGGRRLYKGGQEFFTGEGGVEEDEENPQQGGGRAVGVRVFL